MGIVGLLGGLQNNRGNGYRAPEIQARLEELAPPCLKPEPGFPQGTCNREPDPDKREKNREDENTAKLQLADELARGLDSRPWGCWRYGTERAKE